MSNTKIYWIHTLSPTHVGTGRGLGYIDLPIHRDALTNWPAIPATAFKGVLADYYGATDECRRADDILGGAFGIASRTDGDSNSGALMPTDARLVCLPVRSFAGTFAWCTCPLALQFLARDLEMAGLKSVPGVPDHSSMSALCTKTSKLVFNADKNKKILLTEVDLSATPDPDASGPATAWANRIADSVFTASDTAWKSEFIARFVIVPDDIFNFFTQTATEVVARTKIDDDTKTVVAGALWNEELLPAETILVGLISCDRLFSKTTTAAELSKRFITDPIVLQIGGKATTGRGRVRCLFSSPEVKGA